MGLALGRLAVALARGRAGQLKNRYAAEQQDFENERQLAQEQDVRDYRSGVLAEQRERREAETQRSTALQEVARQMRERRVQALQAQGIDPARAEALADDEVAFRSAMAPQRVDPLSDEGLQRRRGFEDYRHGLSMQRLARQLPRRAATRADVDDDDVPRFLRPDVVAGRAAKLTAPGKGQYGQAVPGLTPEAAADSARREAGTQAQAAFTFELSSLNARLERDQAQAAGDQRKLAAAQARYARDVERLRARYGVSGGGQ